MSVPSFLSAFARISDPVSSATGPLLDHATAAQVVTVLVAEAEPLTEHLVVVLPEHRRLPRLRRPAVVAHRPSRHLEPPGRRMIDLIHDAARPEARMRLQLHGVEHRAGGHAARPQDTHRLALVVLAGPG